MTDARALCAASLRSLDPRCGKKVDPPFFSLLDRYSDTTECAMTLITQREVENSSWPPSEADALTLLLQHVVEEAYKFASVYFRVISYRGPNGTFIDKEGLNNFVIIILGSLLEFLEEGDGKESLTIVARIDGTAKEKSVALTRGQWSQQQLLDTLQQVVNQYDKNGNDEEKEEDVPSFLDPSLADLSSQEYTGFFLESFLSQIKRFLRSPTTTKNSNSENGSQPKRTSVVDDNEFLDHCLWYHHDASTLLTESCPVVMEEATIRIQELAYERRYHDQQQHDDTVSFCLQRIYCWISWLFVALILWEIHRIAGKESRASTNETRRLRQCLVVHVVLSMALWLYGGSILLMGNSQAFLDASLVSLSGFLGSSLFVVVWDDNDDDDGYHYRQPQHLAYELPLLNDGVEYSAVFIQEDTLENNND
jgi:hypothetical protein